MGETKMQKNEIGNFLTIFTLSGVFFLCNEWSNNEREENHKNRCRRSSSSNWHFHACCSAAENSDDMSEAELECKIFEFQISNFTSRFACCKVPFRMLKTCVRRLFASFYLIVAISRRFKHVSKRSSKTRDIWQKVQIFIIQLVVDRAERAESESAPSKKKWNIFFTNFKFVALHFQRCCSERRPMMQQKKKSHSKDMNSRKKRETSKKLKFIIAARRVVKIFFQASRDFQSTCRNLNQRRVLNCIKKTNSAAAKKECVMFCKT